MMEVLGESQYLIYSGRYLIIDGLIVFLLYGVYDLFILFIKLSMAWDCYYIRQKIIHYDLFVLNWYCWFIGFLDPHLLYCVA